MKILVVGAGAIGAAFGAFLAKNSHHVVLYGRKRLMNAIKKDGLHVSGIWGEHHIRDIEASSQIDEITSDFDLVLLAVKSFDTTEATKVASQFLKNDTLLISLQNGINNYEKIIEVVPPEKVVMGRVIFGVEVKKPGAIYVSVYAEEVQIGQPYPAIPSQRIIEIAEIFTQAGIPTLATEEIMKYIWAKLLYNSALNPLSALLEVPYGELPQIRGMKDIMDAVIREIFCVAGASKTELFWKDPVGYSQLLYGKLIPSTSAHYASMHHDLSHGKKTEIEAINGAVAELGRKYNIAVPINAALALLIESKEKIKGGKLS